MIGAPGRIYSRFTDCGRDDGVAGGQAYRYRLQWPVLESGPDGRGRWRKGILRHPFGHVRLNCLKQLPHRFVQPAQIRDEVIMLIVGVGTRVAITLPTIALTQQGDKVVHVEMFIV